MIDEIDHHGRGRERQDRVQQLPWRDTAMQHFIPLRECPVPRERLKAVDHHLERGEDREEGRQDQHHQRPVRQAFGQQEPFAIVPDDVPDQPGRASHDHDEHRLPDHESEQEGTQNDRQGVAIQRHVDLVLQPVQPRQDLPGQGIEQDGRHEPEMGAQDARQIPTDDTGHPRAGKSLHAIAHQTMPAIGLSGARLANP